MIRPPEASSDHVARRFLAHGEIPAQVDRVHPVPLGVGQIEKRHAGQDGRAADDDVERTQLVDRPPDQGARLLRVSQIGGQRDGAPPARPELVDQLEGGRAVPVVVRGDIGPLSRQRLGDRPSDAMRPRARHQGPLPLERHPVSFVRWRALTRAGAGPRLPGCPRPEWCQENGARSTSVVGPRGRDRPRRGPLRYTASRERPSLAKLGAG